MVIWPDKRRTILDVCLTKSLAAQAFFPPPPPFSNALCPFLGWICYYSMPTVLEFGGADSTWIQGQLFTLIRLHLGRVSVKCLAAQAFSHSPPILDVSLTKSLAAQAFFPLPHLFHHTFSLPNSTLDIGAQSFHIRYCLFLCYQSGKECLERTICPKSYAHPCKLVFWTEIYSTL